MASKNTKLSFVRLSKQMSSCSVMKKSTRKIDLIDKHKLTNIVSKNYKQKNLEI